MYESSLPVSPSDRQGFNKRWYAGSEQLRVYRPITGPDVAEAFGAILADDAVSPDQCQVTCGRHCYENFVYNEGTRAIIDVTGLKAYGEETVDGVPSLYVEVGLGNWDMYWLLNNVYQKTIPAGSCYSVGLGGHITGGGYGVFSRVYGLSIDYLTGVDIVVGTRDGGARLIEKCSPTNEPDLFWAVRGGGGGQFGIITRYYFGLDALPDAPDYIHLSVFGWDWKPGGRLISENTFSGILDFFQENFTVQDESSWNTFGILHANHMDAKTLNIATIEVYNAATHGDRGEFEKAMSERHRRLHQEAGKLSPLHEKDVALTGHPYIASTRALGLKPSVTSQRFTFLEGVQNINGSGPNRYGKYKSAYHTEHFTECMKSAAYEGLTQVVRDENGETVDMSSSLIQCDAYGGKINTVAPDATAVPQRNSIIKLQYQSYWDTGLAPDQDDPVLQAAHVNWINSTYQNIYAESGGIPSGPGTDGCYFNYPDIEIGSADPDTPPVEQALDLYFGENLPRLKGAAASYNPEGWFRNSQSITNVL